LTYSAPGFAQAAAGRRTDIYEEDNPPHGEMASTWMPAFSTREHPSDRTAQHRPSPLETVENRATEEPMPLNAGQPTKWP
jgi:hypothetical protein